MAYTPEELALLTEEERAGLEDPDLVDDAAEEEEEDGDEAGAADDSAAADDAAADDANKDDAAAADDAGDDDAANAGRDDGEDDEADLRDPVPVIRTEAPADVEAKLADIDKREDELTTQFDDGDITSAEYRAELRKLERERGDIEKAQLKHDLATQFNEAQAEANWQRDVKQFLEAHPEVVSSELRTASFDLVVKQVTAATMKEGKLPGTADLEKAYKEWSEQLGIKPAAKGEDKKGEDKKGEDKKAADAAKPKADAKPRPAAPPTLATVPAAQVSDTDDGKWANLDRLMETDPIGFEKALAKMSEADREAYLAAS